MKELNYPFDTSYILSKKKKIRKELLKERSDFIDIKIAVLGGSTTSDITKVLDLFLLNHGIRAEFYESEYNRYYEEAVFQNEELEKFSPDIIYIHTTNRNITNFPKFSDSEEAVNEKLNSEYSKFDRIWSSLFSKYSPTIIQNNFEMPFYRLLGNKDASDIHGRINFLTKLNMKFYEYAQNTENFYIIDLNYISADYGLSRWQEPFYWYMYKYAMNVNAIPYLSYNVANVIKSILGKNKKGYVLDLDNTLWGGVIGEDGVNNIKLGQEEPYGQAFTEFQKYLKEQKNLGIVLNISSKNEIENAIAGLNHVDSILKPDDFIEIKANFEPKNLNFIDISNMINLLPESLVFVDDNPVERDIVASIDRVETPEMTKPEEYIRTLDRSAFFEVTMLSNDDLKRNEMYAENKKREELIANFEDYGEYLKSLKMTAQIESFREPHLTRIATLTNKSNQFNLTTRRYTKAEIEGIMDDNKYIAIYGRLVDKFGDNGIVSVVIGEIKGDSLHIDLWIMSCRVLKRDMEFAMMDELVKRCKENNINNIVGYYLKTPKNKMVRDFYKIQGFKLTEERGDDTVWELNLKDGYKNKNKVIEVEA